jgi:hypothetical protein
MLYEGKIVYWNTKFGFIENSELGSVFFSFRQNSKAMFETLTLFDDVSFKVKESMSPMNKGKLVAHHIQIKSKGDFSGYNRQIGVLRDWNGRFGLIDYPTEGKKIFLFHTRLVFTTKIQSGQLIVFNPIKSTKGNTPLFAFFAYPLIFEKDIEFLKKEYSRHPIPGLKKHILKISQDINNDKFELELIELEKIETGDFFSRLIKVIKKYKEFNYTPNWVLLSKYVSTTYLIQLFEMKLINSYNIKIINDYFIKASANTKRLIASIIPVPDRVIILSNYFEFLRKYGKIDLINNDIKILLDILYRKNKNESDEQLIALYRQIKEALIETLNPKEIIDLWLHDYLDEPSESYIVNNFSLGDSKMLNLLLQKGEKYTKLISKIYEQYFMDFANKKRDFETEYPDLIKYLHVFSSEFEDRYKTIIDIIKRTLNSYQKFVLWILNIDIDFDPYPYIKQNYDEINHYFRLKFILRFFKTKELDYGLLDLLQITQEGLIEFARQYKWNNIIYPVMIDGFDKGNINYFITDIEQFNTKCNQTIDVIFLSEKIYQTVEKYNEIHIRLWLRIFTKDKDHYNYVGFRGGFKSLTNEEKKEFRAYGKDLSDEELFEYESIQVKPCLKFSENLDNIVYSAFIENIHFGNEQIKLKRENGEYTNNYPEPYSNTGLNRIPSNHLLNKICIRITVNKENEITHIEGLDEIFYQIHTGDIEKALGQNGDANGEKNGKYPYVEDWKLRKDVIDYLNENQISNVDSTNVYEPKNFYRHLDETSGVSNYELTTLFTIKTDDGYAIIWENIDLIEDRATHIFKCKIENHKSQIEKITHAIISLAQLRSTLLLKNSDDENLEIFRTNLGYIASIRKQRGKNEPFPNWLGKLEVAVKQPIPDLPSPKDVNKLENWFPDNPHHPKINKPYETSGKKATIIEDELDSTDIFGHETNVHESVEPSIKINVNEPLNEHESLLKALKEFNQYCIEKLKIK